MQFIFPSFLWALAFLAIPVIIHLFHFRRFKKVYFTNVHLLREIKEETSSRNRLKSLLILLARLLMITMMVLAFAQPVIHRSQVADNQPRAVTIFIDNSFSMRSTRDDVPLLTIAKDKAAEIVNGYSPRDRFLIMTHDLQTRHQRLVDQETALGFISDINPTPRVEMIDNLLQISNRLTSGEAKTYKKDLYLLSDFQKNIASTDNPPDTASNLQLIPLQARAQTNVAITDVYFESPVPINNMNNNLIIVFENYGSSQENVQFNMRYEGQERPLGTMTIPPRSVQRDTVQILINRVGWHEITFQIDDFPVTFDDSYFISFNIQDRVDLLNIYEDSRNEFLGSALNGLPNYFLTQTSVNNLAYDQFKSQDLIILDDLVNLSTGLISALSNYVQSGGKLLIFPSQDANLEGYNNVLRMIGSQILTGKTDAEQRVSTLNTDEFIFNDVFESTNRSIRLPETSQFYTVSPIRSRGSEVLMNFRDGRPFLIKNYSDQGIVYLSTAPFDDQVNDLVLNGEIFVPMIYKMALSGRSGNHLAYTIGEDQRLEYDNELDLRGDKYALSGIDNFIPGILTIGSDLYLDVRDQVSQAGTYSFIVNDETTSLYSFNYNRLESDMVFLNNAELRNQFGETIEILDNVLAADLSQIVRESSYGKRLWKWCISLALVFLLIETALLRFWK